MPNAQFGSGVATFIPNAGNLAINPTPIQVKVLQEASVEFKAEMKKLFGQNQLPVAQARGKIDVTGKCKLASYNVNDLNQIYWGQVATAGGSRPTTNELHLQGSAASITGTLTSGSASVTAVSSTTGLAVGQSITGAGVPAATTILTIGSGTLTLSANATSSGTAVALTAAAGFGPVTPNVGSGLTVATDLGVLNGDTGASMIRVPSAPAVGQYAFVAATTGGTPSAAQYLFNAAETASKVKISYTSTSSNGTTVVLANQPMGYAPVSTFYLYNYFNGKLVLIQLNAVLLGAMSLPTKQDDFWVADIDFSAATDASDTLGLIYADN